MLLILFHFFPICWHSPFISPEPKLPQIFENQKLSSGIVMSGSSHHKFFSAVYWDAKLPFHVDSEARDWGRESKWERGTFSEGRSFSDAWDPGIALTARFEDCLCLQIFSRGRAATQPDKIHWNLQLRFWQAQSHIVSYWTLKKCFSSKIESCWRQSLSEDLGQWRLGALAGLGSFSMKIESSTQMIPQVLGEAHLCL